MLKALYGEFTRVYGNLRGQHKHSLAAEHTLAQESAIYNKNNKVNAALTFSCCLRLNVDYVHATSSATAMHV